MRAWIREEVPDNLKNRVIVVPQVSDSLLATGWPTRAKTEGAKLIRKTTQRSEVTAAALALLEVADAAILVTRPCYLALRRAVRDVWVGARQRITHGRHVSHGPIVGRFVELQRRLWSAP